MLASDVAVFVRGALPPAPARVLEVGAGDGELATALAAWGYDVVAIDPREDAPAPRHDPRVDRHERRDDGHDRHDRRNHRHDGRDHRDGWHRDDGHRHDRDGAALSLGQVFS